MIYRFGVFEFDDETKELRRNGRAVALEPQPAKALALLLSRAGDVVSREELREAVWGKDTHVDFDRGLAYCLSQIRDGARRQRRQSAFVQTIPKTGFKFIAPGATAPQAASQRRSPPRRWGLAWRSLVVPHVVLSAFALGSCAMRRPPESRRDRGVGLRQRNRPCRIRSAVAGLSDLVVERLTKLDPIASP
jgi:DNA-binding winged helix-turn-helix (wHTH) protein